MPSVAIYGDSGMGKTMIMKRFRDEHPPGFNATTGTLRTPVSRVRSLDFFHARPYYPVNVPNGAS